MKDNEGCFLIIGIILLFVIISGIGELIKNYPALMICIILGIVLISVIIYKISQYNQRERYRQQQIERERQARIEKEKKERLERERKEKERLEELKYETVTVVFAYIEEDGKPTAILKRDNNTYSFVERKSGEFGLGLLKLLKEITEKLSWVSEMEYREQEAIKKQRAIQLQQKRDRQQQLLEQQRQTAEQLRLQQLYATYKNNWQDFQRVLQQNNISKLYHFTDRANLQSIRQNGGLYSWNYCQRNGITIPRPGGSQLSWNLDMQKGLQNCVRLAFVKDHPMLYVAQSDGRIINPVILEISSDVIFKKETKFATRNAAKGGVSADGTFEKFSAIKFPILRRRYFDLDEGEKPYYQAEVLVLEKIPLEYILNINTI
jgi:hypothetical protein